MNNVSEQDKELIQAAIDAQKRLYKKGRHEVAAALRCKDGKIYTGIHINALYSGYADVCGEVVAISCAVADGRANIDTVVAVVKREEGDYKILPPCGRCREILRDFDKNIRVIMGELDNPEIMTIDQLIPLKPAESFWEGV